MRFLIRRARGVVLLLFVTSLGLVGSCGGQTGRSASGAEAVPSATASRAPVVREILAATDDPPGAPGRRLTLVRYTIAPGAKLAPHIHPGVQVASIVSSTLTYHVVSGSATVQRAVGSDGAPRSIDQLVGPTTTVLGPGDVIIENAEMVHFGANETGQPVVILGALITDPTRDLAVPMPQELRRR